MEQKKLWFKAKRYGWGWYPVSWQGWAVMVLYIFALVKGTWSIMPSGSASIDLMALAVRVLPPTIFLIVICYAKGERARWRWGNKSNLTK